MDAATMERRGEITISHLALEAYFCELLKTRYFSLFFFKYRDIIKYFKYIADPMLMCSLPFRALLWCTSENKLIYKFSKQDLIYVLSWVFGH